MTGGTCWTRVAPLLLLALVCLGGPLPAAHAGDGARRADDPSLLDISVYFDFEPGPVELENWETVFKNFSAALYDATEAQLRLGTVQFTTCQSQKATADVWIHGDGDLAASTVGSPGLGQTYSQINLYRGHQCPGKDTSLKYTYVQDDASPDDPCTPLGRQLAVGTCVSVDAGLGPCDTSASRSGGRDPFAKSGPFGILHEAGHYLFGLADEYTGEYSQTGSIVRNDAGRGPYIHCSLGEGCSIHEADDQQGNDQHFASIMDGGTSKIGRNERTEFCYSGESEAFKHKSLDKVHILEDVMIDGVLTRVIVDTYLYTTDQEAQNQGSCWDTLVGQRRPAPGEAVGNPLSYEPEHRLTLTPISGPPKRQGPPPTEPVFEFLRGTPAFVLLIDTSRSMTDLMPDGGTRLEAAIEGARKMLDTVRSNEQVGIIAFNSVVHPYVPNGAALVQPASAARLQDLQEHVAGLVAERNTATGAALQLACEELKKLGPDNCTSRSILLVSDGRSTVGVPPLDLAHTFSNIRIYTLGLGDRADDVTLQTLADETLGKFVAVKKRGQLGAVLVGLLAEARGDEGVLRKDGILAAGGRDEFSMIQVPASVREVSFLLEADAAAPLRWEITDPNGVAVARSTDGESDLLLLREANPQAGAWTVTVLNQGPETADYRLLVTVDAPKLEIGASIRAKGTIPFTQPLPIQATVVAAGGPILGAQVMARVSTSTAFVKEIELFDDGDPCHGDLVKDDGRYSALFSEYAPAEESGSDVAYEVEVVVEGECGRLSIAGKGRGEDGVDAGGTPYIPSFSGHASVSVVITDVPSQILPGTVAFSASGDSPIIQLTSDQADVTAIMPFKLAVSGEGMTLSEVSVTSVGTGNEATVDEMSLFLDANADGRPDNRHRPLARTRFNQDDGRATFRVPTGFLATVPGGEETHFVIGFSSRLGNDILVDPGVGGAPVAAVAPAGPFPFKELLALALLTALAIAARYAQRRTLGHVAIGTCVSFVFLALIAGGVGCGGSTRVVTLVEKIIITKTEPGNYSMVLRPEDVKVVGATSGASVEPIGVAFAQIIVVTPAPEGDE